MTARHTRKKQTKTKWYQYLHKQYWDTRQNKSVFKKCTWSEPCAPQCNELKRCSRDKNKCVGCPSLHACLCACTPPEWDCTAWYKINTCCVALQCVLMRERGSEWVRERAGGSLNTQTLSLSQHTVLSSLVFGWVNCWWPVITLACRLPHSLFQWKSITLHTF